MLYDPTGTTQKLRFYLLTLENLVPGHNDKIKEGKIFLLRRTYKILRNIFDFLRNGVCFQVTKYYR